LNEKLVEAKNRKRYTPLFIGFTEGERKEEE
jgi:hypothetical protein